MPTPRVSPFGHALRHWRTLRRLSQLELATLAETPPRHVSFLETGRARPSEGMVHRLAAALDLTPQDQNTLLATAGFAPAFKARELSDHALSGVQFVIKRLLESHEPYPALVVNAWYDVLMVNRGAAALFTALGVGADGATPPNLIELLLGALRASIVNDGDVLRDTYQRLRRDLAHRPGDDRLVALLGSVSGALDALPGKAQPAAIGADSPVLLTKFRTAVGPVATLSVMVHFSGAHDVTVHDLHVELIYPADTQAATVLQQLTTAM